MFTCFCCQCGVSSQYLPRQCHQKHRCLEQRWIRQFPQLFFPSPCSVAHQACPGPGLWFQGLCLRSMEGNSTRRIFHYMNSGETEVWERREALCTVFITHPAWEFQASAAHPTQKTKQYRSYQKLLLQRGGCLYNYSSIQLENKERGLTKN